LPHGSSCVRLLPLVAACCRLLPLVAACCRLLPLVAAWLVSCCLMLVVYAGESFALQAATSVNNRLFTSGNKQQASTIGNKRTHDEPCGNKRQQAATCGNMRQHAATCGNKKEGAYVIQ
jgi:hypothetical protein